MGKMGSHWVIDRIEGNLAVVEGLGAVPLQLLPEGLREGDIIQTVYDTGTCTLMIDGEAKAKAEKELAEQKARLKSIDMGPDGILEL